MRDVISRPIQTFWGKQAQKTDFTGLINSLLEEISHAEIVVSSDQLRIVQVNKAFLRLYPADQAELIGLIFTDFFESIDISALQNNNDQTCMLKQINSPSLAIMVTSKDLDSQKQWKLVQLVPLHEYLQIQRNWNEEIIEAVAALLACTQEDDPDFVLKTVVEITHKLFDTNLVCIYQAESTTPEMKKTATSEKVAFFPDVLPSTDLIRLNNEVVWTSGKRVKTELHKAARQSDLSYIASVPLAHDKATIGLFVVGGLENEPPPILLRTIKLFAVIVGLNVEQAVKEENYRIEFEGISHRQLEESSILEYMREGLLILNHDLAIKEINPAAELLLGYTSKEVSGNNVENILISPDRLSPVFESAKRGVTSPNLESVVIHDRKGQTFLTDIKIIPVTIDNKVISIHVYIHDVSEKEKIRAQTRQLEQRALLGEFMGVFAHEVLNPINSISTGLQLMTRNLEEDNPNRELVSRMENDCVRLHHQMEALKNFAKPYEPMQEPVDLKQLLIRVSDRWRPRMERLNVQHNVQIDEKLPTVIGDWRAFEQVFTNLISNAIDAMSEQGGLLSIRARQGEPVGSQKQVEITISDTGPGIPEDIKAKIFEPFVTSKAMGTGLGLAITKRIITAHRGSIIVNSVPGGTVFKVNFPASEEK